MADETLRGFLARRRRELENQLVATRGRIAEIEAQIAEVDQAEKALPAPRNVTLEAETGHYRITGVDAELTRTPPAGRTKFRDAMPNDLVDRFAHMTIKQLVMQALRDKHPAGLATGAIGEFIRDAYNRAIAPDSLRPQILRLKTDGWIIAVSDAWHLTKAAVLHKHTLEEADLAGPPEVSDEAVAHEMKRLNKLGIRLQGKITTEKMRDVIRKTPAD
jgi:hypothetical protein